MGEATGSTHEWGVLCDDCVPIWQQNNVAKTKEFPPGGLNSLSLIYNVEDGILWLHLWT